MLLATHASRIHIVSVPVDIGVFPAANPRDMAIERWLHAGPEETQYVINMSENFEELPVDTTKESDKNAIYTLAMESQVR
jgi:hypothetical protein